MLRECWESAERALEGKHTWAGLEGRGVAVGAVPEAAGAATGAPPGRAALSTPCRVATGQSSM